MCCSHLGVTTESPGCDHSVTRADPDPETEREREALELTTCSCSGNQSRDAARHATDHEIHFEYLHP